jgi:hypothetical protein
MVKPSTTTSYKRWLQALERSIAFFNKYQTADKRSYPIPKKKNSYEIIKRSGKPGRTESAYYIVLEIASESWGNMLMEPAQPKNEKDYTNFRKNGYSIWFDSAMV